MGNILTTEDRIKHFEEFHKKADYSSQTCQASRCMSCGVPFCQAGMMISGMASGCPLNNLVPETNELVASGNYEQAYIRISKTHPFPEFTSRVCPALCEAACTQGHCEDNPVPTKENEGAIIDYAFEHDLVKEPAPKVRTGKSVAVIGSGPAGLSAALYLNRRGHKVTVYERDDRVGGLLRYGIPNMKLDKRTIDRRVELMKEAGVEFICNADVGKDVKPADLLKKYDRVIICTGAKNPRDVAATGRDAKGIYFAVDFLKEVSKKLMDNDYDSAKIISAEDYSFGSLKGKHVVVIGGGDTGNDCVGTSVRLGAANVTQLEMMPKAPLKRTDKNPWPEWPKVLKTDYGQEEAAYVYGEDPRIFKTTVTDFVKDKKGNLKSVKTIELESKFDKEKGRFVMEQVPGTEKEIKADIVLIAAGFLGCESYVMDGFKVDKTERSNIAADDKDYKTNVKNVFAAGDARRGQSLVVWALEEGRKAAKAVDTSLMGYSNL